MKEKRRSHGQQFLIITIGLVVVCFHQKYYVADAFSATVVRHSSANRRRRTPLIESLLSLSSSTSSYNNNYNYSPTKQRPSSSSLSLLDQAGGAIYKQSVFTSNEFATIVNEVATLTSNKNRLSKETSSIAQHRLGAKIPSNSKTIQILKEGSLTVLLQKLLLTTNNKDRTVDNTDTLLWELSTDLPVEVRLYEKFGSNMAWHIDDVLYKPQPQIEVVITLENTSDCVTMWKAAENNNNQKNEKLLLHCQETDPNSVLILKSGGPEHCVTSLKRGRRMILKCAYIAKNSKFCGQEIQYKEQFGHVANNGGGSKKKKNKKRGKKSKR